MRIHVTGGSGFLGGHVIPLLAAHGHAVTALARSGSAAERVVRLGAEPVLGDLDDPASLDGAFAASAGDALVNLASLGFGHAPAIVAAAEEEAFGRAIFVSTTAIFTRLPTQSKSVRMAAEDSIRDSGLAWTILRPTMIYGAPGDRNMARLLGALRRFPALPLPGGGRGLQQPVHVDDLAAAVVSAVEGAVSAGVAYDIAGPEPLTLRQIIDEAAAAIGRHPRLVPVPLKPAIAAARVYERIAAQPRLKAEQLERLAEDKAFDIRAARRDLGYDPRSFEVGIRQESAQLAMR
jgi:uncharacterized protein YbjT (DUF2867 family)